MPRHGDRDDGTPTALVATLANDGGASAPRHSVAELAGSLPSLIDAQVAELSSPEYYTVHARPALCRWGGWALGYLLVAVGLWKLMDELYFGFLGDASGEAVCDATFGSTAKPGLEYFVGCAPTYYRGSLLLFVVKKVCESAAGFKSRGGLSEGLVGAGGAERAGWLALVQPAAAAAQPTWAEAREARGLTQRQAVSIATLKLMFWHLVQPTVYLGLLFVYRCFVAKLGKTQQALASVVAAREVLYIVSLVFATAKLPAFLLLDLRTVWTESASLQRFVRLAMYVLTPHNYVALCSAARFPDWRRAFLGLAATQVIADLASCFALAALLASTIEQSADATTAGPLKVGYSITAFGFLLFFGPLSIVMNLEAAATGRLQQHCVIRVGRGIAGASLLLAWGYLMLVVVLLMFGKDVFCPGERWYNGLTFQGDPCIGHGACYAAAQCRCDAGFGPEASVSGEQLCARHGVVCTAGQLQRAVADHEEAGCGGPHFPGSRLLTPEWGEQLNEWTGRQDQKWELCYSSFTHGKNSPLPFHLQCSKFATTLTVLHNSLNHTFGGFVRSRFTLTSCFCVCSHVNVLTVTWMDTLCVVFLCGVASYCIVLPAGYGRVGRGHVLQECNQPMQGSSRRWLLLRHHF
jgi:hypothetical protein